jgi:glycosyltransferase involved in cell wall biosynthesis
MKKILHINTYDVDGIGKAVIRIHNYLVQSGFYSKILVKEKQTQYKDVIEVSKNNITIYNIFYKVIKKINRFLFSKKNVQTNPKYHFFNFDEKENFISANTILNDINFIPDIIIVYWISRFCNLKTIYKLQKRTKAKILFYPLDMSIITGGCHYAWDCEGFQKSCLNCPAISNEKINIAQRNLEEKLKWLNMIDCEIISSTKHLENQIQKSILFKNRKIHKNIFLVPDKNIFKPYNKLQARKFLNIEADKKIIFIGAANFNDERKGLQYFQKALEILKKRHYEKEILILLAGTKSDVSFPFQTHFLGKIQEDEKLAKAYQASDIFVCSSVEDSGPMMVNESISCGTPVIAFDMGVAKDLIIGTKTGYIAKLFDSSDLAEKIDLILRLNENDIKNMQLNCYELSNKLLLNENIVRILS